MLTGNGSLSIKKKDIVNQKIPATGFKKTVFAHKATAGQTGIDLTLLTAPTELTSLGFSQPSGGELTNANLLFFRNNLKLVSSVRGQLVDFLSYTVASSTRINFQGFTALEGEIFIGYIDYNAVTSSTVVDASPVIATGTLAASTTDFNVGTPFKVNQFSTQQVGAVTVFLDGVQQYRNTGNSSSVLDGNYYEVDNGSGLGTIIRFNQTSISARSVAVTSNGLLFERPTGSMMAAIESMQGQVNNMGAYVAALAGLSLATVLGGAPSYQDLSAFGDRVLAIESNRARIDQNNTWTAPQTLVGRTDGAAAGVNDIGYKIVAPLTSNPSTTVADTYVDATGNLVLPPGAWMVGYCVTAGIQKTAALGSTGINGELVMRDTSNNAVADLRAYMESQGPASTISGFYTTFSRTTFIDSTTTVTYKMSARCSQATANGSVQILGTADITGGLSGNDNAAYMWAVRIR